MKLSIEIESENASALEDPQGEVVRALLSVASAVSIGRNDGYLHDTNGNKIGYWSFELPEEDDDDET